MVELYDSLKGIDRKISSIRLFKYNVEALRKFSFGVWTSRQHIFISIHSGEHAGYGENIITINEPDVSLDEWESWARELVGLTITEAFGKVRSKLGVWRDRFTEMTEMALLDLAGKEEKCSSLELLGLPERHPVNGAFVILNDDPDFVRNATKSVVQEGLSQIIKVKLFGKEDVDKAVIAAVKEMAPRGKSYLIGDVNTGYRRKGEVVPVADIAQVMRRLYEEGLDACEDPAALSIDEWVELQSAVSPLALIPDAIMRPSWESIKFIKPGMGDVYNIHPGSAGSILDAVELARKIKAMGAGLMIGDDSLVGPACTGWQQIAIGLGAVWVEAVEKKGDSDRFFSSVISCSTDSSVNPIRIADRISGFGLVLDEEKLGSLCMEVRDINS